MTLEYLKRIIECVCGCGMYRPLIDNRGRERRYIKNHDKKHPFTNEHIQKLITSHTGKHYDQSSNWKGGRIIDAYGYIQVKRIGHRLANSIGYVLEHRLVWEDYHKCCLLPWIVIHHRNGIRSDNRIENLQPMTNSEHVSLHHKGIPVKCR